MARDCFLRSLGLYQLLVPDSLRLAMSLNNMGGWAYLRRDLPTALDYFLRGLRLREKLSRDSLDVADSLSNIGLVYLDCKN